MIIEKSKDNHGTRPVCGWGTIIELAIKETVNQQNAMSKMVARKCFLYFQILSCFVTIIFVTRCYIVFQICITGFYMKFTQLS